MLSSRSTAKTIFLNLDSYSHQQPLTKTMEYESNSWDKEKPNSICKSRKKSVKDKKISNRDETTNSVKSNLVCGKGGDTTYYNTNNEESSNLKKSKIIPGKGGPKKVHSRHPSAINYTDLKAQSNKKKLEDYHSNKNRKIVENPNSMIASMVLARQSMLPGRNKTLQDYEHELNREREIYEKDFIPSKMSSKKCFEKLKKVVCGTERVVSPPMTYVPPFTQKGQYLTYLTFDGRENQNSTLQEGNSLDNSRTLKIKQVSQKNMKVKKVQPKFIDTEEEKSDKMESESYLKYIITNVPTTKLEITDDILLSTVTNSEILKISPQIREETLNTQESELTISPTLQIRTFDERPQTKLNKLKSHTRVNSRQKMSKFMNHTNSKRTETEENSSNKQILANNLHHTRWRSFGANTSNFNAKREGFSSPIKMQPPIDQAKVDKAKHLISVKVKNKSLYMKSGKISSQNSSRRLQRIKSLKAALRKTDSIMDLKDGFFSNCQISSKDILPVKNRSNLSINTKDISLENLEINLCKKDKCKNSLYKAISPLLNMNNDLNPPLKLAPKATPRENIKNKLKEKSSKINNSRCKSISRFEQNHNKQRTTKPIQNPPITMHKHPLTQCSSPVNKEIAEKRILWLNKHESTCSLGCNPSDIDCGEILHNKRGSLESLQKYINIPLRPKTEMGKNEFAFCGLGEQQPSINISQIVATTPSRRLSQIFSGTNSPSRRLSQIFSGTNLDPLTPIYDYCESGALDEGRGFEIDHARKSLQPTTVFQIPKNLRYSIDESQDGRLSIIRISELNMAKEDLAILIQNEIEFFENQQKKVKDIMQKVQAQISSIETPESGEKSKHLHPNTKITKTNQITAKSKNKEKTTAIRKTKELVRHLKGKKENITNHLRELRLSYSEVLRENGSIENSFISLLNYSIDSTINTKNLTVRYQVTTPPTK